AARVRALPAALPRSTVGGLRLGQGTSPRVLCRLRGRSVADDVRVRDDARRSRARREVADPGHRRGPRARSLHAGRREPRGCRARRLRLAEARAHARRSASGPPCVRYRSHLALVPVRRAVAAGRPIVVLCRGDRRVSEDRLREASGAAAVRRTTADEAKRFTGYAIGGVPPFAHETPCETLIDADMSRFEKVWAAAGLPDAVFEISVADLRRLANAKTAAI